MVFDDRADLVEMLARLDRRFPQPYFHADMNNVDQTGIAPATYTKLLFPNVVSNVGGFYDPATSRWTPPAGNYTIFIAVHIFANLLDQDEAAVAVGKDGSIYLQRGIRLSGASDQGIFFTIPAESNGASYFESFVWVLAGAGNKSVNGVITKTIFAGVNVGY